VPDKQPTPACPLPLPGADMRPAQAKATLDLWGRLAAVKGHKAFGALRKMQDLIRRAMQDEVRGVSDPNTMRTYRARHAAAGMLDRMMATFEGIADRAAALVTATGNAAATPIHVPFYSDEKAATRDRDTAIALDELVNLPGWRDISLCLCTAAWVFDSLILSGAPGDEVFYQEARARIVDMFTTDVQAAIDRGVGASAWLSAKAEREKE